MQQNIDIPEIDLVIHPKIQEVIEKSEAQGKKATYEDLGNLVEDSDFLNQLQQHVNRWIGEIQKVTLLDRDAGSGTALRK